MEIKLAITSARIIPCSATPVIPHGTVLVGSDGRLAAVGAAQEIAIPAGTPTFDATGLSLLPGLIDGHIHLTWDKRLYGAHARGRHLGGLETTEHALVRAAHHAQLALAGGVTTVRECGADDFSVLALRDMIDRGNLVGPRILAAGRVVTTTGGHLYTGWGVDSGAELIKAVRTLADRGVDLVKIMVSGGQTSPGTNFARPQYGLEELRRAVDDAHRLGLPVVAHAVSATSVRLAAEAGVDTIEHCGWIGEDRRSVTPDEEAVTFMLRNGVRVDHAIIPRPCFFPDEVATTPTAEDEWRLATLRVRWSFLRHMRGRGVTVFLGTDAVLGPWPGTDLWPGFQDLARAIEIIVRWGEFSPAEGIAMATREAARAIGLADEVGTVEPGRRADLVLLRGDPLADIRALRQAEAVFRDGRLVARQGQIVLQGAFAGGDGLRGWELPHERATMERGSGGMESPLRAL